ncbi:DUF1294 domain-containing protein [Ursidibacter arcticus]
MMLYIAIYFICVNCISAYLMYIDKQRAIQKAWRVPESNLFFFCVVGGFLGTYLMMKYGRHKTQHWQFHAVVILSFFFWIFILPAMIYYFIYYTP